MERRSSQGVQATTGAGVVLTSVNRRECIPDAQSRKPSRFRPPRAAHGPRSARCSLLVGLPPSTLPTPTAADFQLGRRRPVALGSTFRAVVQYAAGASAVEYSFRVRVRRCLVVLT